ncbi:MAG: glutathione binding-like protein, partial [Bdellovibrionota bacterium]
TSVVRIEGVERLRGVRYRIIPDRIEAGTWMMVGAMLRSELTIEGARADHLAAVIDKLFPRAAPVRASMLGYGSYEDTLNTVEKAILPGPFILGDRFTMADLLTAAQLGWNLQFKSIEPRPAFVEYVERCQARPAAKRADEQAMAIMEKMKTGR